MPRRSVRLATALLLLAGALALPAAPATAAPGYLSAPDLHGDRVVFSAEGDLWIASLGGGSPRRLTSHPGRETQPAFSPDGSRIAFTAEYDGNRDLFVVPSAGGEPRRLTWHPDRDEAIGWTPDGTRILFRSTREHPHGSWEMFSIPADGGDVEKLPLGWAARLDIDPATGLWAFSRIAIEHRTWKRYRGGMAPEIWAGDPVKADFRELTHFDGTDAFPMWHGGRLWFQSDQGGTANLWSMMPDGSDRRRETDETAWDVRWPAMGPDGRIVYVLGADLHVFDPATKAARKVEVDLPSDRVLTRVRYPDPGKYVTSFDLSPDGGRIALVARGEIFSVPVKKEGVTIRITKGSGARERDASYGPGGERIAYVSDEAGEESIVTLDAWGRGEPAVVKPAADSGWNFPPAISPDGKWVAWADQTQTLFVAPAAPAGRPQAIDRGLQDEIRQYRWSPDGRWLAYAKTASRTDFSSIWLFDTKTGKIHAVTGPNTSDHSPAWDPKGRYLYFLGDRTMNPFLGGRDFETVELRTTRPYVVLLRGDVENPFAPLAGAPGKIEERKRHDEEDREAEETAGAVGIDLEGLSSRIVEFPVPLGSFSNLQAAHDRVYWLRSPLLGMAEDRDWLDEGPSLADLVSFDLEKRKAETLVERVGAYVIAPRARKIAFSRERGEIYVVDAGEKAGADLDEARVSLGGVVLELDPREEWRQIYHEAWRHMRDFHWEPGMGGLDWKGTRDRYEALLPRIGNREDLRDLLGELIGELATSHTYVWGGDPGVEIPAVGTGLLGADLVREGGAWKVARILRGDPADRERSPLVEPEAAVREGEFLLSVNHQPFPPGRPYEAALAGLAGKDVLLTVGDRPAGGKTRDVVVRPLGGERGLRYADWVRRNRERVAERTGGKIGYLHVPDMGTRGLVEFDTWFYPQIDREGMIVDVRWNGGGFVSQLLVARLRRTVVSFDRSRGGGVFSYPSRTLNGPFVVLTNEFAGSDGDIFPTAVQLEGLAPVIGRRSWGGVIGIRADKPMVDGGILTQPEYAWWDPKQGWSLENRGVIPDIELDNLPQDLARGLDAQLERGIEEVLRLHREDPPVPAAFGPAPAKTREAFERELPGRK